MRRALYKYIVARALLLGSQIQKEVLSGLLVFVFNLWQDIYYHMNMKSLWSLLKQSNVSKKDQDDKS